MAMAQTPVTLLTGFLGAGKTTLLNRILRGETGRRIGILVNDFGAVNIDARLVDAMDGQAIDLSNGCVCCTMQGDLRTSTLKMLSRTPPVEHIVVEASGISDPIGVVQAFRTSQLRDRVRVDGVVAVVDAENALSPRLDRQLVEDQIRAADIVLLNKVDLVDREDVRSLEGWVRALVPGTRIVETMHANAPLDVVLGLGGTGSTGEEREAHDIAGYGTWSYEAPFRLDYRRAREAFQALPPTIYRAKGVLYLADAPGMRFVAQMVGRRTSIDVAGLWEEEPRTQLVFIGAAGAIEGDDLCARFDACRSDLITLMADAPFRAVRRRRRIGQLV
jgi:G3E family GTPase